jgi:hypothetical protein
VILLGDGEFDGIELLEALRMGGWGYVCRKAKNVCLYKGGPPFGFGELYVQPGDYVEIAGVAGQVKMGSAPTSVRRYSIMPTLAVISAARSSDALWRTIS